MDSSNDFEKKLQRELVRVDAPAGFADRVIGRVAATPRRRLLAMPGRAAWMAVAAMLLVGIVLGGWQWRQRKIDRERQQAEAVQRQFDMAMQVTERTLAEVQMRIGRAGVKDSDRQ